ncbi:MAG: hypothetical protein HFH37_05475 [Lachnospiraceae bacterium]|jgi:predicted nucleic acid-binding protein|nr:hypothetical protein [Lachnospiraceae bacterium]
MQKNIILMMEYQGEQSWAEFSLFMQKIHNNHELYIEDVRHIQSHSYVKKASDNRELVNIARKNTFKLINNPQELIMKEQYSFVFMIHIEISMLSDIVELRNYYLIWREYCEEPVILWLSGGESDYYKVSPYLRVMNECYDEFYNSIYYHIQGRENIIRLAVNEEKERVPNKLLPLIPVDGENDKFFRKPFRELIDANILNAQERNGKWKELPGVLKRACRTLYQFWAAEEGTMEDLLKQLDDANTLTVLLAAYWLDAGGMSKKKQQSDNAERLQRALKIMKPYALGVLQLIENAVQHSISNRGIISLRLFGKKDAEYLNAKYDVLDTKGDYIEITVADYTADLDNRNIAENFRRKYAEQKEFKQLSPKDFFDGKSDGLWREFYKNPQFIAKHFGLRIFAAMVKRYDGAFVMESYSSHKRKKGECYSLKEMPQGKQDLCMPGTCYSILLPLLEKETKNFDVDMADKLNRTDSLKETKKYQCVDIQLVPEEYQSSKKQQIIERLIENFQEQVTCQGTHKIILIDAARFRAEYAEVMYKTLVSVMLELDASNQMVLYHCEEAFVEAFLQAMEGSYDNSALYYQLSEERYIHLFEKIEFRDTIIVPGNVAKTEELKKRMFLMPQAKNIIPIDIAAEINCNGVQQTIFEHYAQKIISNDIQKEGLGCKMNHVHMRLGSTIHVNSFYEAEILFGNKLFVDRFALLACSYICDLLKDIDKLTLYGYTNSAELVISKMIFILRKYKENLDIDYMILDRTKEEQGFAHVDGIRYSSTQYWNNEEERKAYFEERKIVCVIPIASTLKTNEKMINLFCEDNKEKFRENILANLELILVSSIGENQYWEKRAGKSIEASFGTKVEPMPHYFVEVELEYEEPGSCSMCFPVNLMNETPLVEVNPSSTIPIQEISVIYNQDEYKEITKKDVQREERELDCLKECMVYGHYHRGGSHFLYYIETEKLAYIQQEEIRKWLDGVRRNMQIKAENYYIVFAPAHYSNALFVQYVNEVVFLNTVFFLIRDDMDKEYRSNFQTKYSNVRQFAQMLREQNMLEKLKFIYIDDNIISGKTFFRAASLLKSLTGIEKRNAEFFEAVIVLLDRNSNSSRKQYTEDKNKFYSYCDLKISTMRNHSNACLVCNLEREARILSRSAVTSSMFEYWNREEQKFQVKGIDNVVAGDIRANISEEKQKRAHRRLVCTHTAKKLLDGGNVGNNKQEVLRRIVLVLLRGSERKSLILSREYFISYVKVISRPFAVYKKEIKEAIFDVLLYLIENLIKQEKDAGQILSLATEKDYLQEKIIKDLMLELADRIRKLFTRDKDKKDLLMVLLKQLTEMKSNYIIRVDSINRMGVFIEDVLKLSKQEKEDFYNNYVYLVKKLLGVSSDTSKCVWFDYVLYQGNEERKAGEALQMPKEIREWMYLENTRVFQDAYDKLDRIIRNTDELKAGFFEVELSEIDEKYISKLGNRMEENIPAYQFKDFREIMRRYKLLEGEHFTQQGRQVLGGNLLLYKFLKTQFDVKIDSSNVQDRCDRLAVFMKHALNASSVTVFMEVDAEYDVWKDILTERYRELTGRKGELKGKKEYLALGTSWARPESQEVTYISGMERNLQHLMDSQTGWYYSEEENIFLWKVNQMGMHPVYIKADMKETDYYRNLNFIRSVVQHYVLISDNVFNRSNSNLYYELVDTGKKLLFNTRSKAHSHTANDIKLKQYGHISMEEGDIECFRSDVLMLLADLNMSEYFRKSFSRSYYINEIRLKSAAWDSDVSIFRLDEKKEYQVPNSEMVEPIKIRVNFGQKLRKSDLLLKPSDEVVCYNVANGGRESFLFIYSLIINVAVQGRGFKEDGGIEVSLTKTRDGRLRIFNKLAITMDDEEIEKINYDLDNPPMEDKEGISLWTVSHYLNSFKAIRLRECLEKYKASKSEENLRKLNSCYKKVKSEQLKVNVSKINDRKEDYFSVELPILSDSYIIE